MLLGLPQKREPCAFFFECLGLWHRHMKIIIDSGLLNYSKMDTYNGRFALWPHYHFGCALFSNRPNSMSRRQLFLTYSLTVNVWEYM